MLTCGISLPVSKRMSKTLVLMIPLTLRPNMLFIWPSNLLIITMTRRGKWSKTMIDWISFHAGFAWKTPVTLHIGIRLHAKTGNCRKSSAELKLAEAVDLVTVD